MDRIWGAISPSAPRPGRPLRIFIAVEPSEPLGTTVATWWPASYVFEWANPVLHGFADAPSATAVAVPLVALTVAIGAALVAARRDYQAPPTPGQ